jgi:hypothetical protein
MHRKHHKVQIRLSDLQLAAAIEVMFRDNEDYLSKSQIVQHVFRRGLLHAFPAGKGLSQANFGQKTLARLSAFKGHSQTDLELSASNPSTWEDKLSQTTETLQSGSSASIDDTTIQAYLAQVDTTRDQKERLFRLAHAMRDQDEETRLEDLYLEPSDKLPETIVNFTKAATSFWLATLWPETFEASQEAQTLFERFWTQTPQGTYKLTLEDSHDDQ